MASYAAGEAAPIALRRVSSFSARASSAFAGALGWPKQIHALPLSHLVPFAYLCNAAHCAIAARCEATIGTFSSNPIPRATQFHSAQSSATEVSTMRR